MTLQMKYLGALAVDGSTMAEIRDQCVAVAKDEIAFGLAAVLEQELKEHNVSVAEEVAALEYLLHRRRVAILKASLN